MLDEPLPASLILLTSEHELQLARILDAKDGIMVMNGAPHTRSWFRNALTAQNSTVNENENNELWRAHHVQLYTPLMLTRYGGNKITRQSVLAPPRMSAESVSPIFAAVFTITSTLERC